jgi:hypothetical protein
VEPQMAGFRQDEKMRPATIDFFWKIAIFS